MVTMCVRLAHLVMTGPKCMQPAFSVDNFCVLGFGRVSFPWFRRKLLERAVVRVTSVVWAGLVTDCAVCCFVDAQLCCEVGRKYIYFWV